MQSQVELKARVQAIFTKMRKSRTLRAFNTWAALWAASSERLERQAQLVWRMKNVHVLWAFNNWRAQCTGVRTQTLQLGGSPPKGGLSKAAAAGGERASAVGTAAEVNHQKVYRAARHWANLVLSRCVRHWRGVLRPIHR
jgi:hypothetical protein